MSKVWNDRRNISASLRENISRKDTKHAGMTNERTCASLLIKECTNSSQHFIRLVWLLHEVLNPRLKEL